MVCSVARAHEQTWVDFLASYFRYVAARPRHNQFRIQEMIETISKKSGNLFSSNERVGFLFYTIHLGGPFEASIFTWIGQRFAFVGICSFLLLPVLSCVICVWSHSRSISIDSRDKLDSIRPMWNWWSPRPMRPERQKNSGNCFATHTRNVVGHRKCTSLSLLLVLIPSALS